MAKASKKIISSEQSNAAWEEIINSSSDHITAILAGSYLEYYLTRTIKMQLHYVEDITEKLFDYGAAASFDTKAKLGRLTGVYGDKLYNDLNNIIKIRNCFAHRMDIRTFEDKEISPLIGKLKMCETDTKILFILEKRVPTNREVFIYSVTAITQFIGDRRSCQMPEPPAFS